MLSKITHFLLHSFINSYISKFSVTYKYRRKHEVCSLWNNSNQIQSKSLNFSLGVCFTSLHISLTKRTIFPSRLIILQKWQINDHIGPLHRVLIFIFPWIKKRKMHVSMVCLPVHPVTHRCLCVDTTPFYSGQPHIKDLKLQLCYK